MTGREEALSRRQRGLPGDPCIDRAVDACAPRRFASASCVGRNKFNGRVFPFLLRHREGRWGRRLGATPFCWRAPAACLSPRHSRLGLAPTRPHGGRPPLLLSGPTPATSSPRADRSRARRAHPLRWLDPSARALEQEARAAPRRPTRAANSARSCSTEKREDSAAPTFWSATTGSSCRCSAGDGTNTHTATAVAAVANGTIHRRCHHGVARAGPALIGGSDRTNAASSA